MLITDSYAAEQRRLHEDPEYGVCAARHAYLVAGIAALEGCDTILDYGCGKGTLGAALEKSFAIDGFREYDPAIPGKDRTPGPADLVCCLDVMEHVEPQCHADVLDDLARVTKKFLFVDVSTKFDKGRRLSDGRNSHLVVEPDEWWRGAFERRGFSVKRTWNTGVRAWVALMAAPK